jgi:hypothetical protein
MRNTARAAMLLAGITLGAASAAAAPFTATLNLASAVFGAAGLQDPLSGLFTVTFDSAITTSSSSANIVVHGLNRTFPTPVVMTYLAPMDTLFIGIGGASGIVSETDDFYFRVDTLVAGAVFTIAAQTAASVIGVHYADDLAAQIAVQPVPPVPQPVPEPAAGALLGMGLAGLALARRRRRTAAGGFA